MTADLCQCRVCLCSRRSGGGCSTQHLQPRSPGLGLLLLSGKLQEGQQLFPVSSLQCFVQIKEVCEAAEAAGSSWLAQRHVLSYPCSGSKAPPGWICRELEGGMLRSQHCSDRALLGPSLKQHHYFRDMYKGKFPVSTVCEGAGPNEGGICHLWKLGDAVDTPPAH